MLEVKPSTLFFLAAVNEIVKSIGQSNADVHSELYCVLTSVWDYRQTSQNKDITFAQSGIATE